MTLFHVLQTVVAESVERLIRQTDQGWSSSPQWKLNVLAPFVQCFAGLRRLELALLEAFDEFEGIARRGGTITKIIPRKKLLVLGNSMQELSENILGVYRTPELFLNAKDHPYFYPVVGPKSFALKPSRVINLFPLACPAMLDQPGEAVYRVRYPLVVPNRMLLPPVEGPAIHLEAEELAAMQRQVEQQLAHVTVDIRDRAALGAALDMSDAGPHHIMTVRRSLALFIRQEFPIDQILML